MAPKSFRKLRGANVFINLDDDTTFLRAHLHSEMARFPVLSKKFLSMVSTSQLYLAPFFLRMFSSTASATLDLPTLPPVSHTSVNITPFVDALFGLPPSGIQVINHPSVPRRPLDSRYYRRIYTAPSHKKLSVTISWKSFWSFSIAHSARNVWYHLLQAKIPCHVFLHSINLSAVTDGACLLCGQPETIEHFVFLCPQKLPFWSSIWSQYFQNSFDSYRLTQALLYLSFPHTKLGIDLDREIIFSSSLLALWRAHWRLVYDAVPFGVSSVITQANILISKSIQESPFTRGGSPFPLQLVNFNV